MTQDHNIQFDLEKALEELKSGKPLNGSDGVMTPLIKQLTEAALRAEQEAHLARGEVGNCKNGYTSKIMKTASGSFELEARRDRPGTFEPQLVQKNHPR